MRTPILQCSSLDFVIDMILGFLCTGVVNLASNNGNLETISKWAGLEVMAQVLQRVISLHELKTILHIRKTTRAVLAAVRLQEVWQHIKLAVFHMHRNGGVWWGQALKMCTVLWVKAWHVELLNFVEVLDLFKESGPAFNRRCCLK